MVSSSESDSSYVLLSNSTVNARFIQQAQKESKLVFTRLYTSTFTIDLNLLLHCDSGKGHTEMEWVLGFRLRARLTVSNIVQARGNGLYLSAWPALQCRQKMRRHPPLPHLEQQQKPHILITLTHTHTHWHTYKHTITQIHTVQYLPISLHTRTI